MRSPDEPHDPVHEDGRGGSPLSVFQNVLLSVAALLLAPRQYAAAGLAFALGIGVHLVGRLRGRDRPPAENRGPHS